MKNKAADYLQKQMDTSYRRKPLGGREKDWNIHVYDLINFCPRAYALAKTHGFPFHRPESIPLGLSYTFHLGNRMQDLVVDQLKAQRILYGSWKCRNPRCKTRVVGVHDPGRRCPKCKADAMRYVDTTVRLPLVPGIDVVGNIDSLPLVNPTHAMIGEIKSIKKEDHDRLTEPIGWHTRQVSLYPWLLDRGGVIDGKEKSDKVRIYTAFGVVTYVTKGYSNKPFKVFPVTPDKNLWKETDKKLATLKKFLASKAKKPTLPKKICDSELNLMAKDCVARMTCFERGLVKNHRARK